jgi:ubiquinone/menaquinone biosynthesis C-methylase UbiE
MKRSYDVIASFYDNLSTLVFGNAVKRSQRFLINFIKEESNVLIIGGGTGWIIEELSTINSLKITYIDSSERMISRAKERNTGNNNVEFINKSIFDFELVTKYDVVITPFLFDNFSGESIEIIIDKINKNLQQNALWLHVDFSTNNKSIWQNILVKLMYIFFRTVCNIEATKLEETESKFKRRGFKIIASKFFYSNFICSVVYSKG